MGNRSKPSKSCEPCRVKRRRCDLKTPACTQCQRAGVRCPGYKDAFTLRMKDETQSTASKVQLLKSNPTFDLERSDSSESAQKDRNDLVPDSALRIDAVETKSSLSRRDSLDEAYEGYQGDSMYEDRRLLTIVANSYLPDQAALSYFMYTYATNSSFHYLPIIYNKLLDETCDPSVKVNLERAMSIPALLLLSQEVREPSLQATARARYTSVLATTQSALEDPQRALLDSTLASVLLLGLVEALEFHGRADPTGWDAHTLGAAALLEMRGAAQLANDVSRQLYCHASPNIKRRCALRQLRVPDGLRRLHQLLIELSDNESILDISERVGLHASVVLENFAALRVDMCTGETSPSDWLARAVGLGDELDRLLAMLWKSLPYESLPASSSRATCPSITIVKNGLPLHEKSFHIYQCPRTAKRWNDLRMMRLYVTELIRDSIYAAALTASVSDVQPAFPLYPTKESAQQLAQAIEAGEQVSTAILQSVPYMLRMSDATKLTGSALVLPLTTVAVSGMAPVHLRLAARESLEYMHDELNVPHTAETLQGIREGDNLEMWATIPSSL